MPKYFRYNITRYKKKLLTRFAIVGVLFFCFLTWNFLQIPEGDRKEFLALFVPMSALLGLFLYRSYLRQIQMLSDISVELDGRLLRQYDRDIESAEYDLKDLEKIYIDEYRSYPRVILEWEDHAVTFVNLENSESFYKSVESLSGKTADNFGRTEEIISLRALVYLIPSVVYALSIFILGDKGYAYLNWETFWLFLNVNLIIYMLYGVNPQSEKFSSVYQTRRKVLFVLLVLFVYQVVVQFSSSLGLF